MVKRWRDVAQDRLTDEQRASVAEWVEHEVNEINLRALRDLLGLTQAVLAERIGTSQAELSRMERRDNHRLSTVRRYVEALGGEVEIRAVFDEKTVKLHI